jgi:hypothetical protein
MKGGLVPPQPPGGNRAGMNLTWGDIPHQLDFFGNFFLLVLKI